MPAVIDKFEGHPIVALLYKDKNGTERKFSFGLVKAKLILEPENLDAIRVFVATDGGQT